tara:strand:+ start:2966 stop:4123 length:1158 start_codon:yes stop_codon:yes gene_type:complete
MSTLLINTNGQSRFRAKTDLISGDTKLGEAVNGLTKNKIALSNTDNQPYLVPRGKVIDVVNNFSWYAGPKATSAALDKIPCVFLTEREQLLSSLISGALYYLNAAAGALDATGNSEFVQSILGKLNSGKKFTDSAGGALAKLREFTGGTEFDIDLLKQHNLKSLQGIYFTTPTGFNYRLPIYGSPSTPTGEWSDGSSGSSQNTIAGMIDVAKDFIEEVATSVNFAQPGVYIEKPRYFDNVKGREESITFPLINTVRRGKQSPIQQNYELLWLLAFQNKPYKTSFARTPPPKIYSVYVPGQFAMPYAFISGMNVEFMGTIRKAKVFVPTGDGEGSIGKKEITTAVPEAYQVTLKFTSLVGDYGNAMISNAFTPYIDGQKVIIGNIK